MRVFIDGAAGTTGLKIFQRLGSRKDLQLLLLPEEARKDANERRRALNSCDIAFLCLPDAASLEALRMIENDRVTIVDTSTAHRTDPSWAYGFPELSSAFREAIRKSRRIAVPGCHASGFIALIYPLVEAGVLPESALMTCHSLTGYSGGGKAMISAYEAEDRSAALTSPREYALAQAHKHLPEMQKVTGLGAEPIFCPIVADYYSGMVVTVPLFKEQLTGGADCDTLRSIYREKYRGPVVQFRQQLGEGGFISSNTLAGKDTMEISVEGNSERILLIARYDNLGKGASGAAVQCLNIAMGTKETYGLELD